MFKKNTFFQESFTEEMLGYMFNIGYKPVFVDSWYVASLLKNGKWFEDELRIQFEGLSKDTTHHLFTVDIENRLEMGIYEILKEVLDFWCDMVV